MAKQELFRNKLFGALLKAVGAFPVKRESGDLGAIKKSLTILKRGDVLTMFPEGSRREGQEQAAAKHGASLLAIKARVPVLPVYIEGSDSALPKGAKWIRPASVRIVVGNLITVEQLGADTRDEALQRATQRIIEGIAEAKDYLHRSIR